MATGNEAGLARYSGRLYSSREGARCGARGRLWASGVAVGNPAKTRLRIYGEKAGLEWRLAEPQLLRVVRYGEPPRTYTRGGSYLDAAAKRVSRSTDDQTETFVDAVATLFSEMAVAIQVRADGGDPGAGGVDFPDVRDGALGVRFVEAAIESNRRNGAWTDATLSL